ncbi:MAG TPA: helical backbone metal receptor [Bryobacteraceae bacterium]|nr:helical backbone metal receptor [Bryobacteraceae bacterium]
MLRQILLIAVFLLQAAQAQPRRIVSTAPSITETLFALGLGPSVVGVSNYCRFPPEVIKLPKVGAYLKPDAEAIARLSPDLVVIKKLSNDLAARLTALGIPYVEVELGTLPQLYATIETLGKAAGAGMQAKTLINGIQGRLNAVRQKAAGLPKPKVLFLVGRRPGTLADFVAVGSDSYLNQLIETAGGVNVLQQPSLPAYPRISLETVIRSNPDFIIDTSTPMMGNDQARAASEVLWQEHKELTAVLNHHLRVLNADEFVVPGRRVAEVVEMLFGILHERGGN